VVVSSSIGTGKSVADATRGSCVDAKVISMMYAHGIEGTAERSESEPRESTDIPSSSGTGRFDRERADCN
jgi:hypothetical protein